MRILVTGASGFVGGYLVPALVAAGHETFALVRDAARYGASEEVSVVTADLGEPLELEALPRVDAVAHFAQANVSLPDEAATLYRVNTASTLDLLEHARRSGASHFLYASSASVYGFGERPFREDDPLVPGNRYAVSKINAENLVASYRGSLATGVFRLVAPYGPGQTGRMIPAVIGRVREGKPVTLNGGGRPRMNPIYVEDAVRVVLAALDCESDEVLNVGGDEVVGIDDIARVAGEACGREPVFEDGDADAPGDVVADTTRLKELGLESLVPFEEGVKRIVNRS